MLSLSWFLKAEERTLHHTLETELAALGYHTYSDNINFLLCLPQRTRLTTKYQPMLVSHMDTVARKAEIVLTRTGSCIRAVNSVLGGDDRCGCYINYVLAHRLKGQIPLLFTHGEESGGLGVKAFLKWAPTAGVDLKAFVSLFIEFDRRGFNELVCYEDAPDTLIQFFEDSYGYEKKHGSYSDVADLSRNTKVAHVNLSAGFFNQHTKNEFVLTDAIKYAIMNAEDYLPKFCSQTNQYLIKERKVYVSTYKYGGSGWYGNRKYDDTRFPETGKTTCDRCKKEVPWSDTDYDWRTDEIVCKSCRNKKLAVMTVANREQCQSCTAWMSARDGVQYGTLLLCKKCAAEYGIK